MSKGNWLYVGGSGPRNYTKIQDAIDNASDGDTVFVYDDSSPYYEHVRINVTLALLGQNRDTTVIDGGGHGDVLTVNRTGVAVAGFTIQRSEDGIVIHAPNVIIQDSTLKNCRYGVKAFNVETVMITRSEIRNCSEGVKTYNASVITITGNEFFNNEDGVYLQSTSGVTVANNSFHASSFRGIDLVGLTGNNTIEGNTVIAGTVPADQASYVGIRLIESSNTTVIRNTLVSLLDTCYEGLQLWQSNDNIVEQNVFIKSGIMLYQSDSNVISKTNSVNGKPVVFLKDEADMTVEDAGQVLLVQCERITVRNLTLSYVFAGVALYNSADCVVEDSSFSLCYAGVYLENSKQNTVRGNTFTSCFMAGIDTSHGSFNLIQNNTFQNSTYYGLRLMERSSTISGNTIRGNPTGIEVEGIWGTTISGNLIENNTWGIFLTRTFRDIIEKNTFKGNTLDATFDTAVRNRWRHNFWERPRAAPKVIGGILFTVYTYTPWPGAVIPVPWLNFDWHPALEPYDISATD